MTKLSIFSVTT